ncbi:MAG: hypothetical protein GXP10_00805, partial [Gammaproteobacteria bacterium]|nr:hypothetical protein [Gammaproteobacteria bacterium]
AANIATSWNPVADGAVNAMELFTFNDTQLGTTVSTLYVGGGFSTIGGQSRSRVAALDTLSDSNTVTPWSTSVTGAAVNTLDLSADGKSLYIGGEFSAVGGSLRTNLAKLDTTVDNAALGPWSPVVDGAVNVIALNHNEEALYLGGEFSTLSGLGRRYLGIVDLGTGAGTDWNPAPDAPVEGLAVRGNSIYSGGQFGLVQNRPRVGLAAFVFAGPSSVADPSGSPVLEPQVVSLSCSTSADLSCVAIHFTVDDPPVGGGNPAQISTPTSASPVFSTPLTIDKEGNTYVRFFAIDSEGTNEVVKTEVYGFDTIAPVSTAAPLGSEAKALEGGVFLTANGDDRVILSCTDITAGCAAIRYTFTVNGEAPNPKSQGAELLLYEGPINVSSFSASQADIKYYSEDRAGNIEEGLVTPVDDNGVATGEPNYNQLIYRIDPSPPTTTASPASMTFESSSLKITLSCEDNGVGCEKTYFTLDGSTPTVQSQQYTGPITISGEEINYTLKFFSTDLVGNQELQRLETYIAIRGDLGGASAVHPLLTLLSLLVLFGRVLFRSGRDA